MASDGETQVGKIAKQYAGFIKEAFTTADNFGISCNFFKYKKIFL